MKWFRFDNLPPDGKVVLIAMGGDVFFARRHGEKIAVKRTYSALTQAQSGADIGDILRMCETRNVYPLWTELDIIMFKLCDQNEKNEKNGKNEIK